MSSDKGTALGNGRIRLQEMTPSPRLSRSHSMPLSPKGQVSIDQIQKPHTPTVLHEPSHLTGTWTGTSPASHSQHLFLFAVILSVCLVALSTVCFVKKCLCLCIFHRLIVFFSVMYILPTISALHPSLILYLPQRLSVVSASIIHFHYTNISLWLHSSALHQHPFSLKPLTPPLHGKLCSRLSWLTLSIHSWTASIACALEPLSLSARKKYLSCRDPKCLSRPGILFLLPPRNKFWKWIRSLIKSKMSTQRRLLSAHNWAVQ